MTYVTGYGFARDARGRAGRPVTAGPRAIWWRTGGCNPRATQRYPATSIARTDSVYLAINFGQSTPSKRELLSQFLLRGEQVIPLC